MFLSIHHARVAPWQSFAPSTSEDSLDMDQFEKGLVANEEIKQHGFEVHVLQHIGVKYKGMEDGYLTKFISYEGSISHEECVEIVKQTFIEMYYEVNRSQKENGSRSATTFSGYLIINGVLITIQLGDSAIFALHKKNEKTRCIPLAKMHSFEDEEEEKRVMLEFVDQKEFEAISKTLDTVDRDLFHIFGRKQYTNQFRGYVGYKLGRDGFEKPIPTDNKIRDLFDKMDQLLENSKNPLKTIDAICCYLEKAVCSIKDNGGYSITVPTRTLGNAKTSLSFFGPDIRLYELPNDDTTFMLTTDGVTDQLDVDDIATVADAYLENVSEYLYALLCETFNANQKSCDNLTAVHLKVPRQIPNNTALFCGVFDGHLGQDHCDTDRHVIHHVKNNLGEKLNQKFQEKVAEKNKRQNASTEKLMGIQWDVLAASMAALHQSHQVPDENLNKDRGLNP